MNPQALPHPPTGPLHILPPWLFYAALVALLFGLLALYALWRSRRSRTEPNTATAPLESASHDGDGFTFVVNQIETEFLASRAFRMGLHALAAAIRTRLETVKHIDAEEMTVTEIGAELDDNEINPLLNELRTRQFGKREPKEKDFKKMCSRAKRALAKGQKSGPTT